MNWSFEIGLLVGANGRQAGMSRTESQRGREAVPVKVEFTLTHFLRALREHGIWYRTTTFNDQVIVFTKYKTIWFAQ